MRVLQLPVNVASQMSATVRGLREIGVEARGLSSRMLFVSANGIETYSNPPKSQYLNALSAYFFRLAQFIPALLWADAIHWHYHWGLVGALDVRLARRLNKKRLVEFHGSDIRIPQIEAADNPYYARVMTTHEYHESESFANSRLRQTRFALEGAAVNVPYPGLRPYLLPNLFAHVYSIPHRIILSDYTPKYPTAEPSRPLIVHSPTAPIIKGTAAVLATMEELKSTHSFDLALAQNMSHAEARTLIQRADIFLDQFVLGSQGVASLEAMAFGKPVVCYLKPTLLPAYPPELPIMNATQDTLPEILTQLLEDGKLRRELGERGRAYVEKYHDAHKLVQQLVEIYQNL